METAAILVADPVDLTFYHEHDSLIASKGLGGHRKPCARPDRYVLCAGTQVFGFVHDMAACDFYFALPGRRSKMFFHLNLASMTYLIGPSALIALLNSLLFTLINVLHPVPPDAYTGMMFFFTIGASEPLTALSVIALYLKIIYLFLFLELFYLLSDKAGRANTMALLINLFWPIVIYFYTDATVRFLPGFPDRVEPLGMPSAPWYELLFRQILSPLSAVITTLDFYEHFWVYAILPIAAWLLCRHFFIKRQVEYARLSTKMNWPFAITQWIGMLSVTLIGGYACHHLRAIIYDATKAEPNVMTPAPFLIGCGLGLILSLWIFNLIRGKGKLAWKPLIAAFLAVLIPFSAWLGVVMSGANGYLIVGRKMIAFGRLKSTIRTAATCFRKRINASSPSRSRATLPMSARSCVKSLTKITSDFVRRTHWVAGLLMPTLCLSCNLSIRTQDHFFH